MIAHVVLLEPRGPLVREQRQAILDAVVAAVARCPAVRSCRIGRRIRHGLPGYEQLMRDDYQYALILEFEDVQGLRDYLEHPDHERLGDFFTTAAASSLAYDYEMVDAREAHSVL